MKIHFFDPPPAQRVGGLEAAVSGLRDALRARGRVVDSALPRATSAGEYHIAHFHGLWRLRHVQIALRCRRLRIPFVVSPHGMLEPWALRHKAWKKLPYYFFIERPFLRSAACLLATAEMEANQLKGLLPKANVVTIPLGLTGSARPDYLAARERLGWSQDEQVLLFLSRVHPKKGLHLLLEALVEARRPHTSRLVIVGGGEASYVERLRAFADANRQHLPRIDWRGEIWGDARWDYFRGADLFCLPTHSENFGLAVLESLQVGTPVMTTRATPWAEHLTESRGFAVEPSVESVKSCLNEFFGRPRPDAGNRAATAHWAHSTFDWQTLACRYEAAYSNVLESAHSTARAGT